MLSTSHASVMAAVHLQYARSLPWVMSLLMASAILIYFSYHRQLRQSSRRIRFVLPTLRLLAMTAILCSILRPVITRARVASERAPVVIMIDDSSSMSVIDSNRAVGECVGIAAALGKLPGNARQRQVDALQTECDRLSAVADDVLRARAERDYARLSASEIEPANSRLEQAIADLQSTAHEASVSASAFARANNLVRTLAYLVQLPAGLDREAWLDHLRDKARSAAILAEQIRIASDAQLYRSDDTVRESCESLQALSRFRLALLAATDPAHGFANQLSIDSPVQCFCVSDHVLPIEVADPSALSNLKAEGSISNLPGGFKAIFDSMKIGPPRAVVLISDGRPVGASLDMATLAMSTGVPIYTIAVAPRAGIRDLAIIGATIQSSAIVGETINLNVDLRATSLRGFTGQLWVWGGSDEVTSRVWTGDERTQSFSIGRQFQSAGMQRIVAEVSAAPGEITTRNNRVERWVNVSAATTRPASTRPATRPYTESEWFDLTGDEGWLRRISESSGGQFFRLDQIDVLDKVLSRGRAEMSRPIEITLWDNAYLLVFVLGCLTAEWGLRKRIGLA